MADPVDELLERIRRQLMTLRRRANAYDVDQRKVVNETLRDLTAAVNEAEVRATQARREGRALLDSRRDLEAQLEAYRDFFESVPVACVVTDRHGLVEEVNQAGQELLGASSSDLTRLSIVDLVAERHHRVVWRAIRGASGDAESGSWELEVVPRNGAAFPAVVTVARRRDHGRLYWTVRDVTAEARRTGEFERTLDRSADAQDARQAFLMAIAHDLRAPLNGLLAGVRAIETFRQELPEAARGGLDSITTSAGVLRRMQTQFLDLERLGSGAVQAHRRRAPIGEAVGRAVESVDLGDRSLELGLSPVEADIDPGLVESMVRNLLENAARHTPSGAKVWVKIEPTDEEVLLVVEDDGPGVPAEKREAVFEMFGRTDPDDRSGGMGAGLYLVRRFARLHGGRAWVEEREGGGASFRIALSRE